MKNSPIGTRRPGKAVTMAALCTCLLQAAPVYADTAAPAAERTALRISVSGTAQASPAVPGVASPSAGSSSAPAEDHESLPDGVKIGRDEAVAKVRALFPQLNEAEVQGVNLVGTDGSSRSAAKTVWDISWAVRNGNVTHGFGSRVHAVTGDVLQASLSSLGPDPASVYYPPKVTQEQALARAQAFLEKAAPGLKGKLREDDSFGSFIPSLFGPVTYRFRLAAEVNGILSPAESVMLTVTGDGTVTEFYRTLPEAPYPEAKPAITAEEAARKLSKPLELQLTYLPASSSYSQNPGWFLGYKPVAMGVAVDAVSGDLLSDMGNVLDAEASAYRELGPSDSVYRSVDGGIRTARQAVERVKAFFEIPEGWELRDESRRDSWRNDNKPVWSLSWQSPNDSVFGMSRNIFAVVEAETGRILELNGSSLAPVNVGTSTETGKSPAAAITQEEADKKADSLIRQLYPDAANTLKMVSWTSSPSSAEGFAYQYQQFYEGIPVEGGYAYLYLNAQGSLNGFSIFTPAGLEKAASGLRAGLSKEQAEELYRKNTAIALQYSRFGGYYVNQTFAEPELRLVYRQTLPDDRLQAAIDARSGELRTYGFDSPKGPAGSQAATDIQGHWAEEELQTMLDYRILHPDESGQMNPDEGMTLGGWMDVVMRAMTSANSASYIGNPPGHPAYSDLPADSPYRQAVEFFTSRKWLVTAEAGRIGLEEALSREQLAVSLVHILGYDKLAAYLEDDKEVAAFADSGEIKKKGAVSIVQKLGLLEGMEDGRFHPAGTVTRAQAAVLLMRLVHLQGKVDTPIGLQ